MPNLPDLETLSHAQKDELIRLLWPLQQQVQYSTAFVSALQPIFTLFELEPMKNRLPFLVAALFLLTALPTFAGLKEVIASYKSKDYHTAFAELEPFAQKGEGQAMYYVGLLLSNGLGVDQNQSEAMRLFQRSAEQGDLDGQNAMGYSYMMGDGVEKNFETAMLWLNKAAAQGSSKAYRNLGGMYLNGWGINKDEVQATVWYRKAAEAGDPIGYWLLGQSYELGRGIPPRVTIVVASIEPRTRGWR